MLSNLEPSGAGDVAGVSASVSAEQQTDAGACLVSFSTNALTQDGSVASVPASVE